MYFKIVLCYTNVLVTPRNKSSASIFQLQFVFKFAVIRMDSSKAESKHNFSYVKCNFLFVIKYNVLWERYIVLLYYRTNLHSIQLLTRFLYMDMDNWTMNISIITRGSDLRIQAYIEAAFYPKECNSLKFSVKSVVAALFLFLVQYCPI